MKPTETKPTTVQLELNALKRIPLLKTQTRHPDPEPKLPVQRVHTHPKPLPREVARTDQDGKVYFIGNATTVIEWEGIRILTDPNFLHAGDHVHLGPGVTAERLKDPFIDMEQLPPLDCILLSHYHEDHFDKLVEASINRTFPIISTPHAKKALESKGEPFTGVHALDFFESMLLVPTAGPGSATKPKKPVVKVMGTPGKHVPPGPLSAINNVLGAVPPTNGWVIEMGYVDQEEKKKAMLGNVRYRIYISGDTLFVDELKEIRERLQNEKIDLMLVHLGGTTIPGPHAPLFMVTMDANQGVKLMQLMDPDVTIPIHYNDYSVMISGVGDFKKEVDADGGFTDRVVYLDRGDEYRFRVAEGTS